MSRIGFCSDSNEFTQRLFDEVEVIVAQEDFITSENCRRREDAASYDRRGVLVESMLHIVVHFYRKACPSFTFCSTTVARFLRFGPNGLETGELVTKFISGPDIVRRKSRIISRFAVGSSIHDDVIRLFVFVYATSAPKTRGTDRASIKRWRLGEPGDLVRQCLRVFVIRSLSRVWLRVFPL